MKKVVMYTDGSSLGNPGAGGWCTILIYNNHQKILKGGKKLTTNNEMELKAVLEGLKSLKEPVDITIFTDSKYVADGISNWIHNWAKNNWKNSSNKQIKHINMWKELYDLLKKHKLTVVWIKGHSGNKMNDLCDKIAKKEAKRFKYKS